MKIAIIGAGLSSATLCQSLKALGTLTIFEKSRGVGGRMATRQGIDAAWDHGAPCFIARDGGFKQFLQPFLADQTLTEWHPKMTTLGLNQKPYKRAWFEPHYVGQPTMNQWIKPLFAGHAVETQCEIESIYGAPGKWFLASVDRAHGPFDWVLSSAPIGQTQTLFADFNFSLTARYQPGFTLLCQMPFSPSWDRAVCQDAVVAEMIRSGRRPGRRPANTLVVHAQDQWASEQIASAPAIVEQTLRCAAEALLNTEFDSAKLHRWRSAKVIEPAASTHWLNPARQLGACGDWGGTQGVESAFLSGKALGEALGEVLAKALITLPK